MLVWWGTEIAQISNADEAGFKLLFEDGPFWISGRKKGDAVILHFNTDKYNPNPLPDAHLGFYELVSAVEKAMRQLASSLFRSGNTAASQQMLEEAKRLIMRIPDQNMKE